MKNKAEGEEDDFGDEEGYSIAATESTNIQGSTGQLDGKSTV